MLHDLEYDICEYSSINYLNSFPMGQGFTALPVFPFRGFVHRNIWVSRAAVERPEQLNGKRIGIAAWANSGLLWERAVLQHEYGLDLASVEWVAGDPGDRRFQPPAWLRLHQCPPGRKVEQMLVTGEIDAMMIPFTPKFTPEEEAHVGRLFPNYPAVEREYFQRTGLFLILHTVVIKNSVLAEHPWVATSVYEGVSRMLDAYRQRHRAANAPGYVWPDLTWADQEALLGSEPWPSGLAANRAILELVITYAVEQGVIPRPIAPEELFQLEGRPLPGVG
jgi:4,5-dihydroxyphthalate decarboxylase